MNNLVLAPQQIATAEGVDRNYLQLQLSLPQGESISAAIAMDDIHEVLAIAPSQLTPVFNMPACVLGLLTRRSRVLWIVDLPKLLLADAPVTKGAVDGLNVNGGADSGTAEPSYFSSSYRYKIVLLRVRPPWESPRPSASAASGAASGAAVSDRALLGLVVQTVKGSVQLNDEAIQPPQGYFSPAFSNCLQGSVLRDDALLHVLQADAIAHLLRRQTLST